MLHTITLNPPHVRMATGKSVEDAVLRPAEAYHFGLELPHFLKKQNGVAHLIVPVTYSLRVDDTIENEYDNEILVTEVVERRKARGDWSENPFDTAPDFVKIRFL